MSKCICGQKTSKQCLDNCIKLNTCCTSSDISIGKQCDPNYVNKLQKILLRKFGEQFQVSLDEGKTWINAEYNENDKTLKYYSTINF